MKCSAIIPEKQQLVLTKYALVGWLATGLVVDC